LVEYENSTDTDTTGHIYFAFNQSTSTIVVPDNTSIPIKVGNTSASYSSTAPFDFADSTFINSSYGTVNIYGPFIYGDSSANHLITIYLPDNPSFGLDHSDYNCFIAIYNGYATCFLAGTPVETDQGEIPIESLMGHTIKGKPILAVTKTPGKPGCLVLIKKGHLGENMPSKDTVISIWHLILYNDKMTQAQKIPGVLPYPYNGETLYNVLMETHDRMVVNNMVVETLYPDHPVAKRYK
jgi:hypothetical protein